MIDIFTDDIVSYMKRKSDIIHLLLLITFLFFIKVQVGFLKKCFREKGKTKSYLNNIDYRGRAWIKISKLQYFENNGRTISI